MHAGRILGQGRRSKPVKSSRGRKKVAKTMREWKSGRLHSGSKKGPLVTSQKQAVAIALDTARRKGYA